MSGKPSKWEQLQNLKDIFESGFITPEEYSFRKQQLIDKLTGTTGSSENLSLSTKSRSRKRSDMSSRCNLFRKSFHFMVS